MQFTLFVNIFNVIVGVGFLSLPQAFANAGVILGTTILVIASFFSFVTATYVVEAMASANAMARPGNIFVPFVSHTRRQIDIVIIIMLQYLS